MSASPKADDVLETPRLRLEPIARHHAAPLFAALGDATIYRFMPEDPPGDLSKLEERYEFLEARRSPDGTQGWLNWAVRLRSESTWIGTLQATVYEDGVAGIAYVLAPSHWGHGYATEGVRRVVRLLFDEHGCPEVFAEVDTRNASSIRLLKRLGFVRVGETLDADFFKGSGSDEFRYVMTRTAYE